MISVLAYTVTVYFEHFFVKRKEKKLFFRKNEKSRSVKKRIIDRGTHSLLILFDLRSVYVRMKSLFLSLKTMESVLMRYGWDCLW